MQSSHSLAAMTRNLDRRGFTYLTALLLVMLMGIMLSAVGQSWKTIMQREREEELIFRGLQYRDALTRWYKSHGVKQATPLRELKFLVEDPLSLTTVRHLRRLYTDPITGKEWSVIADPNKGISGVYSPSTKKPLKKGGFPDDLADFAGKSTYADWKFVYNQKPSDPNKNPVAKGGMP